RAPTNTEINQAPVNFKLKTEKINTYEVNLIYKLSPQFLVQLNGFRNELSDVIILGNLVNLIQNKNPGKITVNGLEAKLDAVFTRSVSGFFNFTYQDSRGKNLVTGFSRSVPGVAKLKANIGMDLKVKDLFTVDLTGNWVGKRQVPTTDLYGPVDGYFLANCALSTERFFNNRISVSLVVRNLFNARYLDPGFRSADGLIYSTVLEQPRINGLFKIALHLSNN
ncbi:MAG TPA: TonB-dependent receptor, partial [Ferruginibacter sp.]|nr:TonB-dependent receptor [Ferruginibacter sp.]